MLAEKACERVSLSFLLENIFQIEISQDRQISGLSLDSRTTKVGDLFCAFPGSRYDGSDFIEQAILNGATAVLQHSQAGLAKVSWRSLSGYQPVPIYSIPHLRQQLSFVAAKYFGHPSHYLDVVGVTGTNGKTSYSHLLTAALNQYGRKCMLIGSLGYGRLGELNALVNTTPEAISTQALLAEMCGSGADSVVMEVSSHGLKLGRVNAVKFKIGVFTNLTHDHLDFHGSMEVYGATKKQLFHYPGMEYAIINVGDVFGYKLAGELSSQLPVVAYADRLVADLNRVPLVYATNAKFTLQGIEANIHSPWGSGPINTTLIGRFNLENILAVIATLLALGLPFQDVLSLVTHLPRVSGRMEVFSGQVPQALVVVDYAHTPHALQQALATLREMTAQKLFCVFGCGGGRDRGKRRMMAEIAERYADYIIVTDDNPRYEDPNLIFKDIKLGFSSRAKVNFIHRRERAIMMALQQASVGDIVLIAGKGSEAYQQYGDKKIVGSDIQIIKKKFLAQVV